MSAMDHDVIRHLEKLYKADPCHEYIRQNKAKIYRVMAKLDREKTGAREGHPVKRVFFYVLKQTKFIIRFERA